MHSSVRSGAGASVKASRPAHAGRCLGVSRTTDVDRYRASRGSIKAHAASTGTVSPATTSRADPATSAPLLQIPSWLDMTGVAWQTHRAVKGGKEFENRDSAGSATIYMDRAFPAQASYEGVLMVDAKVVGGPGSFFSRRRQQAVRLTLLSGQAGELNRQAVAGYYAKPGDDSAEQGAVLWMRTGTTTSPNIKVGVVKAFTKEGLQCGPKVCGEGTLCVPGGLPVAPNTSEAYTVQAGDYTVEATVSFVPLKDHPAAPAAAQTPPNTSTINSNLLLSSIARMNTYHTGEDLPEWVDIQGLGGINPLHEGEAPIYQAAKNLGNAFPGGFWEGGRPLAYIDNDPTTTQVVAFWNPERKEIAVAFGGTDATELQDTTRAKVDRLVNNDILTDAEFRPVRFDEFDAAKDGQKYGLLFGVKLGTTPADVMMVHRGFLKAWRSIQAAVDTLVSDAVATSGRPEDWKVYMVGHSLGGALATLATASSALKGRPADKLALYTYGCPYVGNRAFLDAWELKVPEQWRTFNEHDTVPTVPRSTGFKQTSQGICLKEKEDKGGQFGTELRHDERAAFFGETPTITLGDGLRISDEAMKGCTTAFPPRPTGIARLRYELGLLKQIITKNGLHQHSSPEYMKHIISVVSEAVTPPPEGFKPSQRQACLKALQDTEDKLEELGTNDPKK